MGRQLAAAVTVVARNAPAAAVSTTGVTTTLAFLVFGRRRRESEPTAPDQELAAAAARGTEVVADAALALGLPGAAQAPDAHLPRWRRPSLLEARKADPVRSAARSVRLSFEDATIAEVPEGERRLIRYRMVRLLDRPDEYHGIEIGSLDQGDEVMLLEKRGTYWRVLCPDGTQGWLHKMTLGDVVIDAGAVSGGETWTSGDQGPEAGALEDVLRAIAERRQGLSGT
jgi:hypothetical protein